MISNFDTMPLDLKKLALESNSRKYRLKTDYTSFSEGLAAVRDYVYENIEWFYTLPEEEQLAIEVKVYIGKESTIEHKVGSIKLFQGINDLDDYGIREIELIEHLFDSGYGGKDMGVVTID